MREQDAARVERCWWSELSLEGGEDFPPIQPQISLANNMSQGFLFQSFTPPPDRCYTAEDEGEVGERVLMHN